MSAIHDTELARERGRRFAPLSWRQAWLTIDKNAASITAASSVQGKIALHLAFFAALALSAQLSAASTALIGLTVGLCSAFPARRLPIIAASSIFYILLRPYRTEGQIEFLHALREMTNWLSGLPALAVQVPAVMLFLALCYAALQYQSSNPQSLLNRRPVLTQMGVLAGMVAAGCVMSPGSLAYSVLWTLTTIFAASFFFLSYGLADQRAKDATPNAFRMSYMRPFWGGPSIPFKGPAFLQKFEAADADQLAVTQLKALKLIVWALILAKLHIVFSWVLLDQAALPTLNDSIAATAAGAAPPLATSWGSVIAYFLLELLSFAAYAHALVAVIRLTGFCIPRNMARPLTSRSIAEFWNRYLFYFKELLVDFFFYPAFARFFKKSPRLRVAFATFCAAFIGNVLFSLISQIHLFAEIGPIGAVLTFTNYMFYALILSVGLVASQLRSRKPQPEDGFLRYEVLPRVWVISFFCLIQIFDDESGYLTVADRIYFFLHLFGV